VREKAQALGLDSGLSHLFTPEVIKGLSRDAVEVLGALEINEANMERGRSK
jgi:hypothetical protein